MYVPWVKVVERTKIIFLAFIWFLCLVLQTNVMDQTHRLSFSINNKISAIAGTALGSSKQIIKVTLAPAF